MRARRLASRVWARGFRAERRAVVRCFGATCWLVSLVALLLLPVVAFAAGTLVTEYDAPANWKLVGEDSSFLRIGGLYGADIDNDVDWSGLAKLLVQGVRTDEPGVGASYETSYSSFEDFAARALASYVSDDEWVTVKPVRGPAERTSLGGLEAYVIKQTWRQEDGEGAKGAFYRDDWEYWIPTDDGGIRVSGFAYVEWDAGDGTQGIHHGGELDPIVADVERVLASLRFDGSSGAVSRGDDTLGPSSAGTSPWRTIVGGLGAVAAAAIAIAGAAAGGRAKSGEEEPPPDQPIGYVLQLSTARLTVSEAHSALLTVQAFRVMPDATYQSASDAAIVLHLPAGLSAQPSTAYGTLSAAVWQTGPVSLGQVITVEAVAPLGGTSAYVPVEVAGGSRIVTRVEPAGILALRTQGGHSLTLVAAVELVGSDVADPTADPAAVRSSITFDEDSEWLEISVAVDYEDGRAVTVMASQPDPTSVVQPPESAVVHVSAQVGERVLTEVVVIALAPLPEIDVRPDRVSLAAESGTSAEVSVWIDNSADVAWQFETEWREGSRPLAAPDITPTGPAIATLTITESSGDRLDPARPESSSTLVVVATADGFDSLRREVQVIVTQEGLFIDRTSVDPSTGAFALKADGSATPTDVDVRVFVRDPSSGVISPHIGFAQQALLEIGGEEGTPGHAGLQVGGFTAAFVGVRPLNVPSATFRVALERALPTGGEALPAALRAGVPGREEAHFSALVPLRLLGVNTDPFSEAWQTELDRCRRVIDTYVPSEHRERLHALVNERSLTMGAEGLYQMRTRLWSFAHDQLVKEAHEHLDAAWWYEQIEGTLDWVSWCGDIALGVASGAYVGVVGSIAIGMLKPLLVSAMETWVNGGSLDDWLAAQSAMLTGVLEGALTDPDFLTKLSGDKKAIGWALFIAYNFAKELYNEPQLSVTNAMKRVGQQLRDEGLIRFLQYIARSQAMGRPRADAAKPKPGAPDAGAAPKKAGAPDGPDAQKRPDADVQKKPEASEKQPEAPEKPAPKAPKAGPKSRADVMAADITAKTQGGKKVDVGTVEKVMRDPDAMRELKKNHPDVWKQFHETRSKVYGSHDQKLKEWIVNNVSDAEGKQIEIESFGTPDGVDRDYRAGYVTTDPATGRRRFIEIKKEKWAGKSAEIFAGETGGPIDPKRAQKWAKDHQQLATDQYHAEASVDMADQANIYNEKIGRWEKTQTTPNVDMVKAGKSTLLDPDGLGKSYETKVAEAYHEGNKLDAYTQADKAVHSLDGVRDGYAKQGYDVRDLPPKVKAGMDVIKDVQSGKLDPAAAEARLKELNYKGGLPDFMEKVSGQFAGFKWARKA